MAGNGKQVNIKLFITITVALVAARILEDIITDLRYWVRHTFFPSYKTFLEKHFEKLLDEEKPQPVLVRKTVTKKPVKKTTVKKK